MFGIGRFRKGGITFHVGYFINWRGQFKLPSLLIPVYRHKHGTDLPLRMPAWSLFICLVLFGSCEGFLFNVSRGAERAGQDLFSNMDPSGTCPRIGNGGRSWCLSKNAECSQQGCCMCVCSYQFSTFRMDSSVNTATCKENSAFRNFAGKLRWFRNFRLLYNNNINTFFFYVFPSPYHSQNWPGSQLERISILVFMLQKSRGKQYAYLPNEYFKNSSSL